MSDELRIEHAVVDLDTVMRYFVEGYKTKPEHAEWFVDTAKGKVIFRLFTRANDPESR